MQQVNLITQMLAGLNQSAAADSALQTGAGFEGAGGPGFMLFLQQQMWASGLPQSGQLDSTAAQQSLDQSAFASLLADLDQALQTSAEAGVGATAAPSQLQGLLQALLASLQQILDAAGKSESAVQQLASFAAGEDTGQKAIVNASTTSASSAIAKVIPTDQSVSLTTLYPVLALAESWQPAIAKLNATLASVPGLSIQLTGSTSQLASSTADSTLPWSLLGANQAQLAAGEAGSFALDSAMANANVAWPVETLLAHVESAQAKGAFGTLPTGVAQTPEAIQWFVAQGLLGGLDASTLGDDAATRSATLTGPAAATTDAAMPKPVQTVTGQVQLSNGESALVTLTELVNTGPTAQYAVQLASESDPGAVLTATLTVERVEPVMPLISLAGTELEAVIATATQAQQSEASVQAHPEALFVNAEKPVTKTEQSPALDLLAAVKANPASNTGSPELVAGSLELAQTVSEQGQVKPGIDQPPANMAWRVNNGSVQVLTPQAVPADQTASALAAATNAQVTEPVVKTTSPVAANRKQASPVLATAAADNVDATLEASSEEAVTTKVVDQALKLSSEPAVKPFAAEFTTLARIASSQLAGEGTTDLSGTAAALQPDSQFMAQMVTQQQLPMSLLQFTQTDTTLTPYTTLNYLDLANQVMAEANQARQSGDGVYTARLNLNPPNLGQLYVNIAVRGETVALQMAVASSAPKSKLDESLAQLKQSLEEAGLKVVELRVVETNNEGESEHNGEQSREQHEPGSSPVMTEAELIMAAEEFGRAALAVPAAS